MGIWRCHRERFLIQHDFFIRQKHQWNQWNSILEARAVSWIILCALLVRGQLGKSSVVAQSENEAGIITLFCCLGAKILGSKFKLFCDCVLIIHTFVTCYSSASKSNVCKDWYFINLPCPVNQIPQVAVVCSHVKKGIPAFILCGIAIALCANGINFAPRTIMTIIVIKIIINKPKTRSWKGLDLTTSPSARVIQSEGEVVHVSVLSTSLKIIYHCRS